MLNKQFYIESILQNLDLENRFKNIKTKVSYCSFVQAICDSGEVSLKDSLKVSHGTIASLTKKCFPEKPRNSARLDTYILSLASLKECTKCGHVLPVSLFRENKSRYDGLQVYCVDCHLETTSITQSARQTKYRASKIQRTPAWANLEEIKEIYANRPEGYHVDHIIPLQGELVCGLHVENNLQYLKATDNCSKNNSFQCEGC